jgi:hypothetical protein
MANDALMVDQGHLKMFDFNATSWYLKIYALLCGSKGFFKKNGPATGVG